MDAAKSLTDLSLLNTDFPEVHIIFSDTEEGKIPEFLEYSGSNFSYQVMEFYNPDDDINSYLVGIPYNDENTGKINEKSFKNFINNYELIHI